MADRTTSISRRNGTLFAAMLLTTLPLGCVRPSALFKRNAELKSQGYYMAEFEFKMLAALYYLNDGKYLKAHGTLRRIQNEMDTPGALVKIPSNASTEEMIEFLLARQDPQTGAFMNPNYPVFSFIGPTANVLSALENLAAKAERPIRLKYPLRFLDTIQTPEQLEAYMDSLLYIQERWATQFSGPAPYVAGVSELAGKSITRFETLGGYRFSDEWKGTLTRWYYRAQDPKTGFWGARIGNERHWTQTLDVDSTAHILKHFLGEHGEVLNPQYPPRYIESLAENLLDDLDRGVPDGPLEQHEWSLRQALATKSITRLLWPSLSAPLRERAMQSMPRWLETRFTMYRPSEGGFAVDGTAATADIDATSTAITFLADVGFVQGTWQRERLRARAGATSPETTVFSLPRWQDAAVPVATGVNSVRVYVDAPPTGDSWDDTNLVSIAYPHATQIPDVMDLRQRLARYIATSGGEFGNWCTKASLKDAPLALKQVIRVVPPSTGPLDLAQVAKEHPKASHLFVMGFDRFQVPVFSHEYRLAGAVR